MHGYEKRFNIDRLRLKLCVKSCRLVDYHRAYNKQRNHNGKDNHSQAQQGCAPLLALRYHQHPLIKWPEHNRANTRPKQCRQERPHQYRRGNKKANNDQRKPCIRRNESTR